jgi:hypothetical protein
VLEKVNSPHMRFGISGAAYWRWRLAKWPTAPTDTEQGYTLLLPVPGDIPVFLELALRICGMQNSDHRLRTLVIPDRPSRRISELVAKAKPSWNGPLDIQLLPHPERWTLPLLRSASRNHGLQLVSGVAASRSSHIILHDADLFLLVDDFFDRQFMECQKRDLDCLGVSPAWDNWFTDHGLRLAATWELVASVSWMRRFTPYVHIGHDNELFGEAHTFDTTLYPQAVSPQSRIDWEDRSGEFVHFNYLISSYRNFQKGGVPFLDSGFRLLLIALFVHLFSDGQSLPDLPRLSEMSRGLDSETARVYYPKREVGREAWVEFSSQLDRVVNADFLASDVGSEARRALGEFDAYYSGSPS